MPPHAMLNGGRNLYLAGTGSFAREVAEWAEDTGWRVAGLVELVDEARVGTLVGGHSVVAATALPAGSATVIAAGGDRSAHHASLAAARWRAATVVHPRAHVSSSAVIAPGCIVALDSQLKATLAAIEGRVQPMLRAILDEEAENRRRLFALRDSAGYEDAFTNPDPLVSVVIATDGICEELVTRALPSLLAQTHANLEVLVVGDATDPAVEEAVRGLGDERVSFWNLSQRLVAHADRARHWLVGSTMARNEASRHARGQWLLQCDHDDMVRSD